MLGLAFAAWSGAAIVAVPFAGGIIERLGSWRAFAVGGVVYLVSVVGIGAADGIGLFAAALALSGISGSFVDTAINAQGTHLERRYDRPIFSGLHAVFSVGFLAGAGMAALAAAAGLGVTAYLVAVAVGAAAVGIPVALGFLHEDDRHESPPIFALPTRPLAVPAALTFVALFAEDIANSWTAVYAREMTGASASVAALVLAAFAAAMVATRLLADGLVARAGAARVLAAAAFVCAAGFALAAGATSPAIAVVAFAFVGAGVGPIFPLAMASAARRGARGAAPALAAASSVGSIGTLVGPPAVGAIGDAASLRLSLAVVAVVVAAGAVVALRLREG